MTRYPMDNLRKLIPTVAAVAILAGCYPSYASLEYGYTGRRYVDLYDYSPGYYGEWRYYDRWTPTIIYEYRGRYYPNRIRGARALQVYRYRSGYFLPPRQRHWERVDRRYDPRRRPHESDYRRAIRPRG
jgi:hypothetical protein